jgi:hypothetical protein
MDMRSFVADLFGSARRDSLTLRHPVEALRAVLTSERSARCGRVSVISETPIQALCGALMASGVPDGAMQVVDPSGAAVMFVESVHQAVLIGSRAP